MFTWTDLFFDLSSCCFFLSFQSRPFDYLVNVAKIDKDYIKKKNTNCTAECKKEKSP